VRVFVILYEAVLMWVRVLVGLPVVAVFVFMLDMFVIMQCMRVGMRHIPVRVLMGMLSGHPAPFPRSYLWRDSPTICELIGPCSPDATRSRASPWQTISHAIKCTHLAGG
jgi:hypothetical protein